MLQCPITQKSSTGSSIDIYTYRETELYISIYDKTAVIGVNGNKHLPHNAIDGI